VTGLTKAIHRRDFLRSFSLARTLGIALAEASGELLASQHVPSPSYDLLVRGGRVIDPAQPISRDLDVAITGGRIVRPDSSIPPAAARHVLDARLKIVTPGLIDIHVHVYDGVAPLAVPADPNCIAKGVTTAVDAGSAGAHTLPGFRKYVINVVETRVYALLNFRG